ncbi:MAG: glycosyltransferase family 4 protein, partial [Candidatus Paceibacterota bacterium]
MNTTGRPIKILFLLTRSDTIGGSSIHVRDLCLKLMDTGEQPIVLLGKEGYFADHLNELHITYHSITELEREIRPLKDVKVYRELKKLIRNLNPDIVSAHSSKIGFLGRLAAHSLGIPVIFTAHGWSFTGGKNGFKRWLFKNLEGIVAKKSDSIICVSDYDCSIGLYQLPVQKGLLKTIHNGMPDVESFLMAYPEKSAPVNICMTARFDQPKDHITLLKALKNLTGYHLHLVGDGPLLHEIRKVAGQFGCLDHITFYGRSEEVAEILSKSQIFTLISNWEGFPRSTLEAMRAGLPVIVSDVGGAAEAIVEGETGFSIARGDV